MRNSERVPLLLSLNVLNFVILPQHKGRNCPPELNYVAYNKDKH
jgi:hypothetical protein